jgi:hypothetical protein
MGMSHDPTFEPLPQKRTAELEWIIDQSAQNKEALVINPDTGVTGSKPVALISPNENTNGLVRYGRHYRAE